jgi:hypothetical protein
MRTTGIQAESAIDTRRVPFWIGILPRRAQGDTLGKTIGTTIRQGRADDTKNVFDRTTTTTSCLEMRFLTRHNGAWSRGPTRHPELPRIFRGHPLHGCRSVPKVQWFPFSPSGQFLLFHRCLRRCLFQFRSSEENDDDSFAS